MFTDVCSLLGALAENSAQKGGCCTLLGVACWGISQNGCVHPSTCYRVNDSLGGAVLRLAHGVGQLVEDLGNGSENWVGGRGSAMGLG